MNQVPPRAALVSTAPPPGLAPGGTGPGNEAQQGPQGGDPLRGDPLREPVRAWPGYIADFLLGRAVTIGLVVLAVATGIATFVILARGSPFAMHSGVGVGLVWANLSVLLLLGLVLAGRLTRVVTERRRGAAGARLHVRLVLLYSGVAVAPSIVVAGFAVAFFHFGIQSWFNDPVRTAITESLQVARGYLEEHRNNIRAVALEMANDINRSGQLLAIDPRDFARALAEQTTLRGLTEAVIYDAASEQVVASAGLFGGLGVTPPPHWAIAQALHGDVVVLDSAHGSGVRAVVALDATPALVMMVGRPVDPQILNYMQRTERAVNQYKRLDANRSWLQIAFAWIFAMVALLVLSAAVLIGLVMANQIARPIGRLIQAAERVRGGDLAVRVPEKRADDEIAGLSRAFNRMTGQLAAQRSELMAAYRQIDERRRFTEAVLSGVSAGVIGLDPQGRIELPNRIADQLLGIDLLAATGHRLAELVPEFTPLLATALAAPDRPHVAEVELGPPARRRTLLVRIGADLSGERAEGFVVTFDDITELQAAQRKAAWADVARRIAHEIKNPLTPIQLAAERLKRRFGREITSDPETFAQCADTIVRHVGDIGRMVDEFSAFARMPAPVIKREDVGRIAREALVLQKTARPRIDWQTDIPEQGPVAPCDRRMLRQALSNLLANAADAVAMRPRGPAEGGADGRIALAVTVVGDEVRLSVTDDGIGLPQEDRARLAEPYVTHKPKGTGLGLAIVKKIMEDHGGRLLLEDRADGPGAVATLILPIGTGGKTEDGA